MFCKIKMINTVYFIVIVITMLASSVFFTETLFAGETEILDNKTVYRGIVDWDENLPTNLTELEQCSDIIIKGVIQEGKENLLINDTFGYTNTKVLVTEVFKGDKDLLNQKIIYREPYVETIINDKPAYIINENYMPAIVNNEYILFLKDYTGDNELYTGAYSLCYGEKGKYPVKYDIDTTYITTSFYVDSLSNEELNMGPEDNGEMQIYREIYKSVLDKYVLKKIIKTTEELGAINKNDRLLVPMRDIAELMGCTVEWDSSTKTACANKAGSTVKFVINSNEYSVNDNIYVLDTPAEIYNNKTYIPLRALSEGLGISITYDSNEKVVTLSY